MQHRSLHVKTIMFTVLGFHKNIRVHQFSSILKNKILGCINSCIARDAIFLTSMKIRFSGSVQQQNPRKLVLNDYQ